MKIHVCGWSGKRNLGDDAYQLAFPKLFPQHDFAFSDTITPETDAQAVVLGGGDVLHPSFLKQLSHTALPAYAISVNVSDHLTKTVSKRFQQILVRDEYSVSALAERDIAADYMPDVALALKGDPENGKKLIQQMFQSEGREQYNKTVLVVINSHLLSDADHASSALEQITFLKFSYDLAIVMDSTPASFILVPFGTSMPWDDRISNAFVMSKCKFWKKNLVCYQPLSVTEALDMISAADAVMSSRLHSSIFSCTNHVPFVDITHNHKNQWFLETIRKTDWSVPYRRFDPEHCKTLLNQFLFDSEPYILELEMIDKVQQNILREKVANVCIF